MVGLAGDMVLGRVCFLVYRFECYLIKRGLRAGVRRGAFFVVF